MTLLDLPGNYGITHYADAVRVGDHHGTVEEARFFDPGCAGHLAIAVFGKPSGEDTVGGIAATLISGEGPLKVGVGPVRTGVTAILPRGRASKDQVFAGWFSLNGNGEMTGTTWIEEAGFLESPVFITNTHSVGVVRDASIKWAAEHLGLFQPWSLPVVAE